MKDDILVIAENEGAMKAHQELFHWPDERYRIIYDLSLKAIRSIDGKAERIHITGTWQYLLRLALGSEDINTAEMGLLLKKLGMPEDEIRPFLNAPINDIFYTLYYGKRFIVLRKLCHHVKQSLQEQFRGLIVDCHMVVPDRAQIVASSL